MPVKNSNNKAALLAWRKKDYNQATVKDLLDISII